MNKPIIQIITTKTPEDFAEAKEIILEYTAWLDFDLSFQNFDSEINNLQQMYTEPFGGLILVKVDNKTAGIVGIRKFEDEVCELKRMFVKETFRNLGIGRMLLEEAIQMAKKFNYRCIKLDTDNTMNAAIKLYLDFGFREISAYRYNPIVTARYFELRLDI
jgi:GNAT superfamily N-acetyltransferase